MRASSSTSLPVERRAYTIEEVAQLFGLCRATVHNMIRDGQLRTFKVRSRRLIPVEAVNALQAGTEPASFKQEQRTT
jgi:excisionase family DNA binding protein